MGAEMCKCGPECPVELAPGEQCATQFLRGMTVTDVAGNRSQELEFSNEIVEPGASAAHGAATTMRNVDGNNALGRVASGQR